MNKERETAFALIKESGLDYWYCYKLRSYWVTFCEPRNSQKSYIPKLKEEIEKYKVMAEQKAKTHTCDSTTLYAQVAVQKKLTESGLNRETQLKLFHAFVEDYKNTCIMDAKAKFEIALQKEKSLNHL